jgi:hypothetical protein
VAGYLVCSQVRELTGTRACSITRSLGNVLIATKDGWDASLRNPGSMSGLVFNGKAGLSHACVQRPIRHSATCACRKSNPDIFVMQSAEDGAAKNAPCPLYGA